MILLNKNNLSKILKFNCFFSKKEEQEKKQEQEKQILDNKLKHAVNLYHNLKQLEFISCFEMHLDKKKESSYSLSFLQELESIKHYAQLNTMQSIQYWKS
ncbi:hypothetical protein [Olleya sp. R77988]|uniref:hypothetical protein n=1 Tax=Olleya sp. R77988 TaxID=3093875 RepID=UPI0037C68AF3